MERMDGSCAQVNNRGWRGAGDDVGFIATDGDVNCRPPAGLATQQKGKV